MGAGLRVRSLSGPARPVSLQASLPAVGFRVRKLTVDTYVCPIPIPQYR